jgi:LysR family hydrogen peroxide-inducible transcriptional activator
MDIPDLSLRDLRAVDAVASHAHFGRAAAALRVAQPTISAQVQRVEKALGVALFERTARRFLVTPEGKQLLPILRQTLDAARRLNAPSSTAGSPSHPVRLGIIPTLGPYLMPSLLIPLQAREAAPRVSITEQPTATLAEMLRDGAIDAAILSLPIRNDAFESVGLFDEPFRLIAPRGSRILEDDPLAPSSLDAGDMVLLAEGHCLRDQALAVCSRRGRKPRRVVTTSLETLKYLVASGEGYSLLPLLASEIPAPLRDLVDVRAFDQSAPARRIGLCFRRTSTARSEMLRLAAFVREHCPAGPTPVRSAVFPSSGVRCRRC